MNNLKFIYSLFVTVIVCLVLGSTFGPYEIVDNYFQLYPIACAVGIVMTVACIILILNFSMPDILAIALIIYYLVRYDYQERLADWKIIYAILLVVFWFALRVILSYYSVSAKIILYGVAMCGCIQALWGILQLYGLTNPYHNIYTITGSFYNPGPYTGYTAFIFPLCLRQLLVDSKGERYVWAILSALLFCIIPAGLSRSAWGALIVSSLFVLALHYQWVGKMENYSKKHFKQTVLYTSLFFVISVTGIVFLFVMKPDSAYGRFFRLLFVSIY